MSLRTQRIQRLRDLVDARLDALEQGQSPLSEAEAAEVDALLDALRSQGEGDAYARLVLALRNRHNGWTASERAARFTEGLRLGSDPVVRDHLRLLLASEHSIAGDRTEAARHLDVIDPARLLPPAYNAYALVLRRLRRFEEAEAAWLGLTARGDLTPGGVRYAWSHIAHLRMTTGRLGEVQEALDAAQAVQGADAHESTLHLLSTRFDFAVRMRDLDAAQAALEAMPELVTADAVEAVRINAASVAALRGAWDATHFREALSSTRADVRLVAATGLMGAATDRAEAHEALLAVEHAHAAAPFVGPEIAWLSEVVADAWEDAGHPAREVARARRWAARAAEDLDPPRARRHRARLASAGVALVGPFQLGEPLGKGGAGTVFHGTHVGGLQAAVKVLRKPQPAIQALLDNELRAVAGLDHPCIASLVDTGLVDAAEAVTHPDLHAGTRWVASELVEGGELTQLRGQIPYERASSLLLALLDALAHAHARDVLHLDIKPANVLLHPSGLPVLVDFGLARTIGSEGPDYLSGTLPYMAPELFDLPWEGVGPSTDVFAAACTLFELLSGRTPFGGSPLEVRRQHLKGPPRLDARVPVPASLQAWLDTAMALEPEERFPSAAVAARALARVAGVDWGRVPDRPRPEMGSASLPLFVHRRAPIVGRDVEQARLRAALAQAEAGQGRVVALVGPEGSGRRALARWVVEWARATGSMARVTVHHGPETPVVAEPGELAVVTAEAWPSGEVLQLGPLGDTALRDLLDRSLRLEPPLAERLVGEAQGSPGRLLGMLHELVELDRVVAGPSGMHLRPLARLPGRHPA